MILDLPTYATSRQQTAQRAISGGLDQPRHITQAFGTLSDEQQFSRFDDTGEVRHRYFVSTFAAPNIGEQNFLDSLGDG